MLRPRLHCSLTAPGIRLVSGAQWILVLASVSFFILAVWVLWHSQRIEAKILKREEAVVHAQGMNQQYLQQARLEGFDLSPQRIETLPQEISFANRISSHQAFSWTRFLSDLETAVPLNISMKSVVPNFRDASIVLTGSADTLGDLTDLVEGLEEHPAFNHVILSSHKIKKSNEKEQKTRQRDYVAFSLKVTYNPT